MGDVLAEVAKEKMQEAQNRVMGSRWVGGVWTAPPLADRLCSGDAPPRDPTSSLLPRPNPNCAGEGCLVG